VLIVGILWFVLTQLVTKKALARIGIVVLLLVIILAFFNPNDGFGGTWWNLLSLPLRPLGLGIVLLGFALRQGMKKVNGELVMVAFLVLLISSVPLFSMVFGQWTVGTNRPGIAESRLTPRTIVVLGRGTTKVSLVPRREVQLTEQSNRLLAASQLYATEISLGKQPLVIVSSGRRPGIPLEQPNAIEAKDLRVILNRLGIPLAQIITEESGVDMRTSAEAVNKIIRDRGLQGQAIALVTSGLEMRRGVSTFAQLGINAIPYPTDFLPSSLKPVNLNNLVIVLEDLVPSVDALGLTSKIIEEYFIRIYYFLRGWQGSSNNCCNGGI
jgi:uncharacterized SAM-binding protein YcdF (DUF218 family)